MTEPEAIAGLRNGDERAFEELVHMFEPRAFAVALVILGDPSLASDAVSEAFLKAFEHRARIDPERGFWPWLLRILVNQAKTELRRRNRRTRLQRILEALPGCHEDPAEIVETNELVRWLIRALRRVKSHRWCKFGRKLGIGSSGR